MKVELSLFGAFRDADPRAMVMLDLPDAATVNDLRDRLVEYAAMRWPGALQSLLRQSAFASEHELLRGNDRLPVDGRMAVLPPVSGG